MSADDKKRKLLEKELRKLGVKEQEILDRLIEEIDAIAKFIIETYKAVKK